MIHTQSISIDAIEQFVIQAMEYTKSIVKKEMIKFWEQH
jgi:hypothetical protein